MNYQLAIICLALMFAGAHAGRCPGTVRYRVSNVCNWRSSTHPTDYPENAMFSPMCGTTHNANYRLFYENGTSTEGLKLVAEEGDCTTLNNEIAKCAAKGNCKTGGYFRWMCDTSRNPDGVGDGVCSHSGMITVTEDYPYVSMVSMVAPSPDWFVGLHDVNLCQTNEATGESYWVDQYPELPARLYAYDAGTDSGETFLSENSPTRPFEPIFEFIARDASNIFYNQDDGVLNPLCMTLLVRE
eukprot:g4232.t1